MKHGSKIFGKNVSLMTIRHFVSLHYPLSNIVAQLFIDRYRE
jgi:hypothetical protein